MDRLGQARQTRAHEKKGWLKDEDSKRHGVTTQKEFKMRFLDYWSQLSGRIEERKKMHGVKQLQYEHHARKEGKLVSKFAASQNKIPKMVYSKEYLCYAMGYSTVGSLNRWLKSGIEDGRKAPKVPHVFPTTFFLFAFSLFPVLSVRGHVVTPPSPHSAD